ncbi:MAG TPA: 4-(cytidine 5'-diphospho)-2-C-methyl-D-erythritol kinase [Sphingomicrobium sp.]|nr:4-(cytidine 5'-diphospho)-2-C-methyl-D-erythritol kinase [Sphingomicrobium sp.]
MSREVETAYAKINLALHVRERMPDGFHRIETIFAFCEDGDELSLQGEAELAVEVDGQFADQLQGAPSNLVLDAASLLLRKRSETASGSPDRGARITLTKNLPVASGIGGGSADAAATLRLLDRHWNLGWPVERLEQIGRELGADVPACVRSETARGTGRGDALEPADLGLSGTPVLLINPRVSLSTADVFARWDGDDHGPLDDWKQGRNDLEEAATALVPQISAVLAWLSAQSGAQAVRMSGSGPTCFALFEGEADRDKAATAVPREWWRLATRLR